MRHVDSLQRILECSRVLSTRDVIACLWAQTPLSGQRCLGSASDDVDAPVKDKKYVDRVKIVARAGRGGKGCVSFWRSAAKGKFVPADGGDGGDGGNVVLRASSQVRSLYGVPQLAQAESGQPGSNQKRHGRRGKDQVVLVPMGTVVSRLIEEITGGAQSNNTKGAKSDTGLDSDRNAGETENESDLPEWLAAWKRPWSGATDYKSDEEEDGEGSAGRQTGKKDSPVASDDSHDDADSGVFHRSGVEDGYEVLADLIQDGDEVIVARGGHGGRGNAAMRALPRRPAPKISEPAGPGEVARLLLELKLLADVALVGLPNVGKSSLLRVLSAATPRVAEYAFTTLYPQLGTVDLGPGRRVVVADVPGLIQGAHRNRGIGLRFLRHVERTSALAFVVDMAGRPPSPDAAPLPPVAQLELLREEVGQYSPDLLRRPWLVVANKIDLLPRPGTVLRALERHSAELGGCVGVVGVSATGGAGPKPKGVESLVVALTELVCPQAGDDKPYSQEA